MQFYGKSLSELKNLPTVPTILKKLMTALNNDNVSNKEIAQLISFDPSLSAKTLSLANSAFFGGNIPIVDITSAVNRLGRNDIKNMVMTIYTANLIHSAQPNHMKIENFWKHSLLTAFNAIKLIPHLKPEFNGDGLANLKSEIYIGGLVHDLGYLILDMVFPEMFLSLLEKAGARGQSAYFVEVHEWNFNHATECANILEEWNLPKEIVNIVRYHHNVYAQPNECYLCTEIVNVADYLVNNMGYKSFEQGDIVKCDHNAWAKFTFAEPEQIDAKKVINNLKLHSSQFISYTELIINP